MSDIAWSKNDELFFKELKEGHAWQNLPALFFQLHGFKVEVPKLTIRENIIEADKWKNSFDLIVNDKPFEIKSRNESFNSALDFPYNTIIVDTVSGFNAKVIKPLAYIMISKPTGSMLCLKSISSVGWDIEKKFDHVRKIRDDFYVCNIERLQPLSCLLQTLKVHNE